MLCYLINLTAHTVSVFVFFCLVIAMCRFGETLNVRNDPKPRRGFLFKVTLAQTPQST